jgi:hypothetical protein
MNETTTATATAKKIFRFTSGSSFGGMCYYPENDAAKSAVPAKRKALRPEEFVELINSGEVVELCVRTFIGTPIAWLTITPSNTKA